jgi:hypothetical protein
MTTYNAEIAEHAEVFDAGGLRSRPRWSAGSRRRKRRGQEIQSFATPVSSRQTPLRGAASNTVSYLCAPVPLWHIPSVLSVSSVVPFLLRFQRVLR